MHDDTRNAAGEHNAEPTLLMHPPGHTWAALVRHNTSPRATLFRTELGLPTSRPLIMTGHQAEFWHPGILAKYLALDAAAGALNAAAAWITVDQDLPAAVSIRYPARDHDGRLTIRTIEYTGASRTHTGSHHDQLAPFIKSGLDHIDSAFASSKNEPAFVAQIASALRTLLRPLLHHDPNPPNIFATQIAQTTLFRELIAEMARNPERVCETYNAAAARHPAAGIRPLLTSDIHYYYELPLWHIDGNQRHRVYAEMLDQIPPENLAPRALFMTALLRIAGCDLFIHGTGGGGASTKVSREDIASDPDQLATSDTSETYGYDAVMEDWLAHWLGDSGNKLAPIATVTATCLLPIATSKQLTPAQIARTIWTAHHVRHNPASLGDHAAAASKQNLVRDIAALPRNTPQRALLFDHLQTLLTTYRETHRTEILKLEENAARARRNKLEHQIAATRTWSFPLYPPSTLNHLRQLIEKDFTLLPKSL